MSTNNRNSATGKSFSLFSLFKSQKQATRRKFLRSMGLSAAVLTVSFLGYVPILRNWVKHLRPPGALQEDKFLAACIKCGQCVQVCPVEAIKVSDLDEGYSIGTVYIDAREQACDFSCDGLQCILACPTGALSHSLNYPHQINMGIARLDKPQICLAYNGHGFKGKIRNDSFKGKFRYIDIDRWNPLAVRDQEFDVEICDLCVQHCPIEIRIKQCESGKPPSGDINQCPPKRAISLDKVTQVDGSIRIMPVIHDGCVGCGACEMVCPTEPAAIVIDPVVILEKA